MMKMMKLILLLAVWTGQLVSGVTIQLSSPEQEIATFELGEKLFVNRGYTLLEPPGRLRGMDFLRDSIDQSIFQCLEKGTIYILTPNPEDSVDSMAQQLLDKGFVRTEDASFQLFSTGAKNRVDVYAKTVEKGEWIQISKWGVVVNVEASGEVAAGLERLPAKVLTGPAIAQKMPKRVFQGIPSLEVTESGRLWAVWYGGPTQGEDENNYIVAVTSVDGGKTWTDEKVYIDPDGPGPVRVFDSEVWVDPDGKLWLFWAQTIGHEGRISGVWAITAENPDVEDPEWSDPVRVADGVMMCKPLVLSSGEWALPVSTWRKTDNSAKVVVSTDRGQTWSVRGGCDVPEAVRSYDEHMLVERTDGSLWLLARTNYGIGQSVSTDGGKTWPDLSPSAIPHPSSRFFIRRLQSGSLLLVKHGSMTEKTTRQKLTAFVSDDDGKSWTGGLLLDGQVAISYPDGGQGADGQIYITYDHGRNHEREILLARFSEEDVRAGRLVSKDAALKQIIHKQLD
jgi:predicted neuraminidase